jgi:hypothetical protein
MQGLQTFWPTQCMKWYEPVWYVVESVDMPTLRRKLGHWLGVTEVQETLMTYVIF